MSPRGGYMRFYVFVFFLILGCGDSSIGETSEASAAEDVDLLQFSEREINLGKIFEGELKTANFSFVNKSLRSVKILKIYSTCLCAGVSVFIHGESVNLDNVPFSPKEVAPHVGGNVRIAVNSSGGPKKDTALVSLFLQSPHSPKVSGIQLKVHFKIVPFFSLSPSSLNLGEVEFNSKTPFCFRASCQHERNWKISKLGPLPESVSDFNIQHDFDQECGSSIVASGVLGPTTKPGPCGGELVLETSIPGRSIRCPLTAIVKLPFNVSPCSFLALGKINRSKGVKSELMITFKDRSLLDLNSIELLGFINSKNWVIADFEKCKSNCNIKVAFGVKPMAPFGILQGSLRLHFGHPAFPIFDIGVVGFVE